MSEQNYDLIIIGCGPGGHIAAERAGAMGKRVLLAEKSLPGGVCLNEGCIPTKTLLSSAKYYTGSKKAENFGVVYDGVRFDFTAAQRWKGKVVEKLKGGVLSQLKRHNVNYLQGSAKILKRGLIEIQGQKYGCENIIIATGSRPLKPQISGTDLAHVFNSTGILDMTSLPKSLAIIGGGFIGCY